MPRHALNATDRTIAARLRRRRTDLGLSMQKVGDAVGVTYQQIQKYEAGKDKIDASLLWEIAQQLQVPIGYFFDEVP